MATAKKLPSGAYRVRVYNKHDGKYHSFTKPTKREAERAAQDYLLNVETEVEEGTVLTFADAAQAYIDARRATLSPTTIHLYEGYVKNATVRLNELKLNEINPQIVQDWVNELTVAKSPKHVKNAYGFFTAVINYHDVGIRLSKIQLPKKTRKFKRLPTAAIVLKAFRGSDIELAVLLAVWGGLRESEILGARKCDIEDDVLTINRVKVKVGKEYVFKTNAKTYNSNRQIKLAAPILSLVNDSNCKADESLVPFNQGQIYKRFTKIMKAEGYHISFHDLRHINASVMAQLGIPDLYAMERGGWSNTATLKQVYQQTFDDERINVDKKIDDFFCDIYATEYDTRRSVNSEKPHKYGT